MTKTIEELLREEMFPGNAATFTDLKKYMSEGRITAFTGAGVSVPIFPTWTGLLSQCLEESVKKGTITASDEIQECKQLLKNDPLELADLLEQRLSKPIFRARLADRFRNVNNSCTDCHRRIAALNFRGTVTLNYDNGHEVAVAASGRNPNTGRAQDISTLTRWTQDEVFRDNVQPILHFHGEVSDPNQMILTASDYDAFYSQDIPDVFISQLWRMHRLLVIGFGFTDAFLTRIAERTLRSVSSDTRHYALIGRSEAITPISRSIFAKKYKLEPIFYQVRETKTDGVSVQDHSDLLSLLNELPTETPETSRTAASPVLSAMRIDVAAKPALERDFRSDLFVAPNGTTLYAEPRFATSENENVAEADEISLQSIVDDTSSYMITCRPEFGATTIARRLALSLGQVGKNALIRDASLLPNYKKSSKRPFWLLAFPKLGRIAS